jgi:hypothetical protein
MIIRAVDGLDVTRTIPVRHGATNRGTMRSNRGDSIKKTTPQVRKSLGPSPKIRGEPREMSLDTTAGIN